MNYGVYNVLEIKQVWVLHMGDMRERVSERERERERENERRRGASELPFSTSVSPSHLWQTSCQRQGGIGSPGSFRIRAGMNTGKYRVVRHCRQKKGRSR